MRSSAGNPAGGAHIHVPTRNANEALDLMEKALALIDAADGPDDAGAHLDLAIHRLRDWIGSGRA